MKKKILLGVILILLLSYSAHSQSRFFGIGLCNLNAFPVEDDSMHLIGGNFFGGVTGKIIGIGFSFSFSAPVNDTSGYFLGGDILLGPAYSLNLNKIEIPIILGLYIPYFFNNDFSTLEDIGLATNISFIFKLNKTFALFAQGQVGICFTQDINFTVTPAIGLAWSGF